MHMKRLTLFCFGLTGLLIAVLASATVVEKVRGTAFAAASIYGSGWFAALWALLAVSAAACILLRRLQRRPAVFLLHLALLVMLAGAAVTRLSGIHGMLHLRLGEPAETFTDASGAERPFPFRITLTDFRIDCYPGSRAPMDFTSEIEIVSDGETLFGTVSMNRIFACRHYRFYQSAYDADESGTTLAVARDPWGIGITYTGYILLLLAVALFFFDRNSRFRRLLRGACCGLLFLAPHAVSAAAPQVLPRDAADELGRLCVCYNDRICPLSTLARDFTVKLCGRSRYAGYTPEQVLSGWLFYYDDWKREPMIRIKDAEVRRLMGLEGRYARLTDFHDRVNGYLLSGETGRGRNAADEKFNIVRMVCTGSLLKLFPYVDPTDGVLHWASQVDDLPRELPHDQRVFIGRSLNYVNELVARHDHAAVREVLSKIRTYQFKTAGDEMPSELRLRAERFYDRSRADFPVAGCLLLAGIAAFVLSCRDMLRRRTGGRGLHGVFCGIAAAGLLYLSLMLGLRGYVCGHWPLSNGYETMQFMAWCTLLLTLLFRRRFGLLVPFGLLVAGLAMAVSGMGTSNPQITPLMPVLSSPLLSIHVMLVMTAYSLMACLMCNGVTGVLLGSRSAEYAGQLQRTGMILLYPAVFTLAAGIFVGAVWANVSWGRYWGWDPKEVWALVTLLVYMLPLHGESLPWFRHPRRFHIFCIAAFLSVLITYFGVNFLLGGMHSYAG